MNNEQELSLAPLETTPEARPATGWLRSFVEVNYFYAFSAMLMVLGCYLLMQSSLLSGGVVAVTVKSFLLLQMYEAVVILTALFIVRRFRTLNDAFILFLVELALLLDPTFFNNSFLTMMNAHQFNLPFPVVIISAATFCLSLLKVYLLHRFLRLRLTRTAWVGLTSAALLIYLASAPLNLMESSISQYDYYYLLGWALVLFGILFPEIRDIRTETADREGFVTESQGKWLPRMILFLTTFVVTAHYIESSQVYIKDYLPLYIVPPVMLFVVLLAKNIPIRWRFGVLFLIDYLCIMCFIYSFRRVYLDGQTTIVGEVLTPPRIVVSQLPLMLTILFVLGTYLYYLKKHSYWPALMRIGLIVSGLFLYVIVKSHILSIGVGILGRGIVSAYDLVFGNLQAIFILAWALLLLAAVLRRSFATWAVAGAYSLVMLFFVTPLRLERWFPEAIQAFFLWQMFLYWKFGDPKEEKGIAATLMAIVACIRFLHTAEWWTVAIIAFEAALFIAIGLRQGKAWFIIAGLQLAVPVAYYLRKAVLAVHPIVWIMVGGVALFSVGLLVTFRKEAILERIETKKRSIE